MQIAAVIECSNFFEEPILEHSIEPEFDAGVQVAPISGAQRNTLVTISEWRRSASLPVAQGDTGATIYLERSADSLAMVGMQALG
jgi:hypothetical protein